MLRLFLALVHGSVIVVRAESPEQAAALLAADHASLGRPQSFYAERLIELNPAGEAKIIHESTA